MAFILPPLPPRVATLPQLPLPFPASGVNSYPAPAQPEDPRKTPKPIAVPASKPVTPDGRALADLKAGDPVHVVALPPLPALPPIRIYSGGKWVTPWYPMRVTPCADRAGLYEMQFSDQPEQLEYWDGKRWPGIAGRFTATAWRGLAYDPATPVT